jgi:hypothetical protein
LTFLSSSLQMLGHYLDYATSFYLQFYCYLSPLFRLQMVICNPSKNTFFRDIITKQPKLVIIFLYGSTALVDLGYFFSFLTHTRSVRLLRREISPSQGRYQHKRTQTSMARVVFEPTFPMFEWAKTVHVLDRAATVIGCNYLSL